MDLDLYRHFDKEDNLLYIGITIRGEKRMREHARRSLWWNDVAYTTYERGFAGIAALIEAEEKAIKLERPRHNVVHNHETATKPRQTDDKAKQAKWLSEQFSKKRSIERANEEERRHILKDYALYVKEHDLTEGVPASDFAKWSFKRNTHLNAEVYVQHVKRVLGPTAPFHHDGRTCKGWTGTVHLLNMRNAAHLYDEPDKLIYI